MIPELFVFIARKRSRDNFARKRKIYAVTRLAYICGADKPGAEKLAPAALEYAHSKRRAGRR